jgi:urease accessory protein
MPMLSPMPTAIPMPDLDSQALLKLLQLVSPALPVGAYSYSEGLETLVSQGSIANPEAVTQWIEQELAWGSIRIDGTLVAIAHREFTAGNQAALLPLNQWLSARRETEEMRQQSWSMGRALTRMTHQLEPDLIPWITAAGNPCNFAVAFALLSAHWQIDCATAVLGYLQSWATNQIASAVKLVPLGQTIGQQILLNLYPTLKTTTDQCLAQSLEDLAISGWGASLASMQHEALYSRLFRS